MAKAKNNLDILAVFTTSQTHTTGMNFIAHGLAHEPLMVKYLYTKFLEKKNKAPWHLKQASGGLWLSCII